MNLWAVTALLLGSVLVGAAIAAVEITHRRPAERADDPVTPAFSFDPGRITVLASGDENPVLATVTDPGQTSATIQRRRPAPPASRSSQLCPHCWWNGHLGAPRR